MAKKKKGNLYDNLMTEEFKQKQIEYLDTIKNNPQYSLIVDPENKYNLTLQQKEFITTINRRTAIIRRKFTKPFVFKTYF